jgi:dephospho-CoA kinase
MSVGPLQVGITGGIGSGKTTVCKVFEILNVPVYYADDRAKHLMNHDEGLKSAIIEVFGVNTYSKDGKLDRRYLSETVFASNKMVEKLNALVHPKIREDYMLWTLSYNQNPYLLREAALLVETGMYKQLDFLITVFAEVNTRIIRVLERDPHRSEKQIREIIKKQVSEGERQSKADVTLNNNGNQLLIPQILDLHDTLIKKANSLAI